MKTGKHTNWIPAYLAGEQSGMASVCGVALDFAAIIVWIVFFVGVLNVIGDFFSEQVAQLAIPIFGAAIWWTYLRITRAWQHSQQMKQAHEREQAEAEKIFLERSRKN